LRKYSLPEFCGIVRTPGRKVNARFDERANGRMANANVHNVRTHEAARVCVIALLPDAAPFLSDYEILAARRPRPSTFPRL
jgi:hypothetical protein